MTDVWRSWVLNDPEPSGVTVVRDSSGVVSYADSPEWRHDWATQPGSRSVSVWRGYKNGQRVELDWVELLLLHGPVTGKVHAVASEVAA